jgi:hypothetical protein
MMETYDRDDPYVHIRHEPDFSGKARVSWRAQHNYNEAWISGHLLVAGHSGLATIMPVNVALRAVALAAKAKAEYDAGLVLSRARPRDEYDAPKCVPAFLFDSDLTFGRMPMPRGWVSSVGFRAHPTSFTEYWHYSGAGETVENILIDIGALPGQTDGPVPTYQEREERRKRTGVDEFGPGRIGRICLRRKDAVELAGMIAGAASDGVVRSYNL